MKFKLMFDEQAYHEYLDSHPDIRALRCGTDVFYAFRDRCTSATALSVNVILYSDASSGRLLVVRGKSRVYRFLLVSINRDNNIF